MMHNAGRKIRSWRKAQNPRLTAHDFGARFGISGTLVYRIENGWYPGGEVMAAMVKAEVCAPEDWFEAEALPDARSVEG